MATRNVTLVGSYLSSGATATGSSTAAGYDAQNVVDLDRGKTWKAGGTGAASIVLDAGAAITVSALAIGNHNGSGWSGVKLQRSSDNVTYVDAVASIAGLVTGEDRVETFAPITYRYWKLLVTGATAAMELGLFYLGVKTELTYNPNFGMSEDDLYGVEVEDAQDGSVVAETWARRRLALDMGWGPDTRTFRDLLRDFVRTEGGPARPFWYVPRDDAAASTSARGYLVRWQGKRFHAAERLTDVFDFGAQLVEEV